MFRVRTAAVLITCLAAPAAAQYQKAPGAATCPRAQIVDTAEECRRAGAAVGHPFNKVVHATAASHNNAGRPGGCFWDQNGHSYFNRNLNSSAKWGGTGGICRAGQDPSLEHDLDRPGADLRQTRTGTPAQCRAECQRDSRCRSFTHYRSTCYLKHGVPELVRKRGCVSGVVRARTAGLERNLDRPGADLRQVRTGTPTQCRAACEGELRCRSFTHHRGTCYLKHGVPNLVRKQGCVSGVVRAGAAPPPRPPPPPPPPPPPVKTWRTGTLSSLGSKSLGHGVTISYSYTQDARGVGRVKVSGGRGSCRFDKSISLNTNVKARFRETCPASLCDTQLRGWIELESMQLSDDRATFVVSVWGEAWCNGAFGHYGEKDDKWRVTNVARRQ